MEDHPPRPNKLRGWWGIVALVVVCLLIAAAMFFWWYHSTGDLEQIRAEAKKRGIPTTWAEAGVVVSSPDVVAKFERLGVLSNQLKDYDSLVVTGKAGADRNDRLLPFLPIPAAAITHHAALDPVLVAEYATIIDQLPRSPLVMSNERTLPMLLPHWGWQRQILRFQSERILLADVDQVGLEVDRALHLVEISESHSLVESMMLCSYVGIISPKIAGRLNDLKICMPDLPERLDRLAERIDSAMIDCFIGEFLTTLYASEHIHEALALMRSSTSSGSSDNSDMLAGVLLRAGRHTLLTHEMKWIDMARRSTSFADWTVEAQRIRAEGQQLRRWLPSETLSTWTVGSVPHVLTGAIEAKLSLRILAAELRGDPWPNDPFDPAGGPLRRIERDGRLMGVYTVGENGIDDGGKRGKDRYFPLYGPLDPPKAKSPTASP